MKVPVAVQSLLWLNALFLFWCAFCYYQVYFKATVMTVDRVQHDTHQVSLSYRHRDGIYNHWLQCESGCKLELVSDEFGFHGDLTPEAVALLKSPRKRHQLGAFREQDQIVNFPLSLELDQTNKHIFVRNGFNKVMTFLILSAD